MAGCVVLAVGLAPGRSVGRMCVRSCVGACTRSGGGAGPGGCWIVCEHMQPGKCQESGGVVCVLCWGVLGCSASVGSTGSEGWAVSLPGVMIDSRVREQEAGTGLSS